MTATPTTARTSRSRRNIRCMVERYALDPDSGGPGHHRGGLGVESVVQALTEFNVNTSIERAVCLPWGLHGGLEGTGNEMLLRRDGVVQDDVPTRRCSAQRSRRRRLSSALGRRRRLWFAAERPPNACSRMSGRAMCRSSAARDYYGVRSRYHKRSPSTEPRPRERRGHWSKSTAPRVSKRASRRESIARK